MAATLHRMPPIRPEHIGSLLRPDKLLKTRKDVDNGAALQQQLAAVEKEAVRDIMDLQIKLDFHPISDGEYRRHSTDLTAESTLPC